MFSLNLGMVIFTVVSVATCISDSKLNNYTDRDRNTSQSTSINGTVAVNSTNGIPTNVTMATILLNNSTVKSNIGTTVARSTKNQTLGNIHQDVIAEQHVKARIHKKMREFHLHQAILNVSDVHKLGNLGHHYPHHPSYTYFLNQFIYVLETVRFCVYQYVKVNCTLSVLYQSMGFEPVSIYIADAKNKIVHSNLLNRTGQHTETSSNSGSFKICMENFSWGSKRIFISIRVENTRNSVFMAANHSHAFTTIGRIKNIEVQTRTISTKFHHKQALLTTYDILALDEQEFIIWMTWVVLVVALMTYLLQVVEVHRIFKEADTKNTFALQGGNFKIGRLI